MEKALKLCVDLEKDSLSKIAFVKIKKTAFVNSLRKLILTKGEALYQSKNTCGIAASLYVLAQYDLIGLVEFSISLYKEGIGTFNGYQITKEDNVKVWAATIKPSDSFNGVSLVLIGSMRFKENNSLRFEKGTLDGMTWPFEVRTILRLMTGRKVMSSFFGSWGLKRLGEKLEKGHGVILLYRTISWKKKKQLFSDPWHYIVLKEINYTNKKNILITYWDYGSIKKINITKWQFYKGVVKTFVLSHY